VDNTATTTYTFTPDAGQCATTATVTVSVGPPVAPTFNDIAPICIGGIITLPTTSINGFTGNWLPAVNNTATMTYTFTPASGQCATTATLTVSVGSSATLPDEPAFTVVEPECFKPVGSINVTSPMGLTLVYSMGGNYQSSTQFSSVPPGTYSLTVRDLITGCISNASVAVVNNPPEPPAVSISTSSAETEEGEAVTLTASGASSYIWSPAESLNTTTGTTVIAKPYQSVMYCVIGIDGNNCADTACTIIKVSCSDLFIPTIFSPNQNGMDDELCLFGTNCLNDIVFRLFNRWGQLIFETEDPRLCWDGTFKSEPVSSGTYTYTFSATDYSGTAVKKAGMITLVK
jgi:gliding motility-associated-like protein